VFSLGSLCWHDSFIQGAYLKNIQMLCVTFSQLALFLNVVLQPLDFIGPILAQISKCFCRGNWEPALQALTKSHFHFFIISVCQDRTNTSTWWGFLWPRNQYVDEKEGHLCNGNNDSIQLTQKPEQQISRRTERNPRSRNDFYRYKTLRSNDMLNLTIHCSLFIKTLEVWKVKVLI
jgi:hypothetical protein